MNHKFCWEDMAYKWSVDMGIENQKEAINSLVEYAQGEKEIPSSYSMNLLDDGEDDDEF